MVGSIGIGHGWSIALVVVVKIRLRIRSKDQGIERKMDMFANQIYFAAEWKTKNYYKRPKSNGRN